MPAGSFCAKADGFKFCFFKNVASSPLNDSDDSKTGCIGLITVDSFKLDYNQLDKLNDVMRSFRRDVHSGHHIRGMYYKHLLYHYFFSHKKHKPVYKHTACKAIRQVGLEWLDFVGGSAYGLEVSFKTQTMIIALKWPADWDGEAAFRDVKSKIDPVLGMNYNYGK